MGSTALRQLLKSLCSNSLWRYAVFWKLKYQDPVILSWEDGYYDYPKLRESGENASDAIYFDDVNGIYFSSCETNVHDGGGYGYPIGLAVADMSCRQYSFGEGLVGEVASTGSYCWVLSENNFTKDFNWKEGDECPDDLMLQFAAGIKTILVVPVLPHGVLQLGSLEWVAEDLALVAYVRDRFDTLQNVAGFDVRFASDCDTLAVTSPKPCILESLDKPSSITTSPMQANYYKAFDCIRPNVNTLSTSNEVAAASTVPDAIQVSGTDIPGTVACGSKNLSAVSPIYPIGVPIPLNQPINASHLNNLESKTFGLPPMDKSQAYLQSNNYKIGMFEQQLESNMLGLSSLDKLLPHAQLGNDEGLFREACYGIDCFSTVFLTEKPNGGTNADETFHKSADSFTSHAIGSELHEALGPAFQGNTNEYICDSSFAVEDSCGSSSLICNMNPFDGTESSWSSKGDDADHLLQALVASLSSCLDDTLTDGSNSIRPPTAPSVQCSDSFESQAPWSHFRSSFVSEDRSAITGSVSLHNMRSTSLDKKQQVKVGGPLQPRKGTKCSNVGKRQGGVHGNQRTRPRDRQMFQDRLKELRQLVPDGGKCSIDALLERAVKHMLHLRSITDQAEKLRKLAKQPRDKHRSCGSFRTKNGVQNGTTSTLELGSEPPLWPILVEDLDYPGHMLIEMVCDGHGLFLEIAQIIRSLEFSILKGTMECHSNHTWAHFIVQGRKGFHRMDIFWPLMHLWQRKRKLVPSKC